MPTRADIVSEARSWLGTPWGHGQGVKGVMVDCAHFIDGVNVNAGAIDEPKLVEPYKRVEDGTTMLRLLNEHMDLVPSIDGALPADVIALIDERLANPNVPRHLAIMTERRSDGVVKIIHASEHGVREHRMDGRWIARIHSIWRIRELDG